MSLAILKVIGIILFLYLSWRDLRDNYREESLVFYGWMVMLSFLVGGRIIFGLTHFGIWNENLWDWFSIWTKPGISLLGGYLSMIGTSLLICRKEGWKMMPFMEDSSNNILIFFTFLLLDEFARTRFSLTMGLYSLIIMIGLVISKIVKQKYRSFVWYHSGKKGFVFFFTNCLVFLMLSLISWYLKTSPILYISFLLISLISLVGLFILGEVFEPLMVNIKRRKNDRSKE